METFSFEHSSSNLTDAEQLFEIVLAAITDGNATEQDIIDTLEIWINAQKTTQTAQRVFSTVAGGFFQASFGFDIHQRVLVQATIKTDNNPFLEMRSYAKALEMQINENPVSGIKVE